MRHYIVKLQPAALAAAVFTGAGRDAGNGYLEVTGRLLDAEWRPAGAGVDLLTDRPRMAPGAIIRQGGQDYLITDDGMYPVLEAAAAA